MLEATFGSCTEKHSPLTIVRMRGGEASSAYHCLESLLVDASNVSGVTYLPTGDGRYCADIRASELPRVVRDSTQYGKGRQGEYPRAESQVERSRRDRDLVRTNWTGLDRAGPQGLAKEQKRRIFRPKCLQKDM